MNDTERGLYEKFTVKRTNGSSEPGGKHEKCRYFVLDLTHDEFARPALEVYAMLCSKKFPALAADLDHIFCTGSPFLDGHSHEPKESVQIACLCGKEHPDTVKPNNKNDHAGNCGCEACF